MEIVNFIAAIITDDPDIINEEALPTSASMTSGATDGITSGSVADKPLSATEISNEADDIAGTKDAANDVHDQLKSKQDAEKAAELEKQRIIKPQIDRLNQSMDKLGTGITQNMQTARQTGTNLDKEMTAIRTMLNNLEHNFV